MKVTTRPQLEGSRPKPIGRGCVGWVGGWRWGMASARRRPSVNHPLDNGILRRIADAKTMRPYRLGVTDILEQ